MENVPQPQEELDNILTLTDEDGNEVAFEFLDLIHHQEREFMVLLPTNDDENAEVVILEIEALDDETESYISVSDPELLDQIYEIFKEHYKDIFTFEA